MKEETKYKLLNASVRALAQLKIYAYTYAPSTCSSPKETDNCPKCQAINTIVSLEKAIKKSEEK